MVKPITIFNKPFAELKDGEWDYELLSPFFALRRNGDKLEIQRSGYHEDSEYYDGIQTEFHHYGQG